MFVKYVRDESFYPWNFIIKIFISWRRYKNKEFDIFVVGVGLRTEREHELREREREMDQEWKRNNIFEGNKGGYKFQN